MKKVLVIALVFALTFVLGYASPVRAQNQIKLPPGPHYTLNIIAVEKDKTATMTNSDRHTIFVGLGSKKTTTTVITRIYLKLGDDFTVCDGNGFDPAYDCDGIQIKQNLGATFQLPCNTALSNTDVGCPDDVAQRSYLVYARALGKPGGWANMMTCAADVVTGEIFCATDYVNVLTLKRSKGKSLWQDATNDLTSLVADTDDDGDVETIALFAEGFDDFFWQYDNYGLRHAQIRLYPVSQ